MLCVLDSLKSVQEIKDELERFGYVVSHFANIRPATTHIALPLLSAEIKTAGSNKERL